MYLPKGKDVLRRSRYLGFDKWKDVGQRIG